MKFPHLFEFMDLRFLPDSLHTVLREILEAGNSTPFRTYYNWVIDFIKSEAGNSGVSAVVELGSGTAPISRLLAEVPELSQSDLICCDLNPDREVYKDLEHRYAGRIKPIYESVDFSKPQKFQDGSLLVLSGTFHHLPPAIRPEILSALFSSGSGIMICEPLRKNFLSFLLCFASIISVIVLPIWFLDRPGRFRRIFWCFLFPVAPIFFLWDGIVSAIRMWNKEEWEQCVKEYLPGDISLKIEESPCCQMVLISRK
jgi:hypothetical protein